MRSKTEAIRAPKEGPTSVGFCVIRINDPLDHPHRQRSVTIPLNQFQELRVGDGIKVFFDVYLEHPRIFASIVHSLNGFSQMI